MANKKEAKTNQVHITGNLRSAFTHDDTNEDGSIVKSTHIISLFNDDEISIDGADSSKVWDFFDGFYAGKPNKYVPSWYKDKSGVTLKSRYNVPIRILDTGERLSFDEFVKRGLIRNASVDILCNVKDSGVYPAAMQINEDGEEYDAFANF